MAGSALAKVRESVDVKLFTGDGELYVLAKKRRPACQRESHAEEKAGSLVA